MSFRQQLFLSVAVLVLVPAIIASLAIGRVVRANENAKADARLDSSVRVGSVLVTQLTERAERRSALLENDRRFRLALATGRPSVIQAALGPALKRHEFVGGVVRLPGNREVRAGDQESIGIARIDVPISGGRTARLAVGFTTAEDFVGDVTDGTGVPSALLTGPGGRAVATAGAFPESGEVDVSQNPPKTTQRWRVRTLPVPSIDLARPWSTVFAAEAANQDAGLATRLVLAVFVGFIVVGFAVAFVLQRALTGRIAGFLGAAERLGAGDFAAASTISTRGRGEFATLGRAFVGMARQLELRVEQLERERGRVQSSLLRLGKAFAANLDRDTLVDLVVESAVDGLTADAGRALMPGPGGEPQTRGSVGSVLDSWDALGEAERRALASGGSASVTIAGHHAIAEPMQVERGDGPLGVISVARSRPFEPDERELLRYLTDQAAVSLRNVGRHEDVARESITDELTGLFNRRRFDDVLASAAARATPDEPIALVMLDLDRFKVINDTHGHPFGDTVLKAVAKVVKEAARDRDLPARYGGEELAVVLAVGDTEAARAFAERLREGIEALQFGDEATGPIPVTASLGVASLPSDGEDVGDLVRAADEALYRAKRAGRNRVEAATPAQGPAGEVR
ncbi:MAG: diguanylate cyclase [Solirubrobacteraceae bacterium]|nr:diguanylate cyclase [Solirubrobacteraceae bacterium]